MKGGISSCFLFFIVSGSSWFVCGMGVDGLVLAFACAGRFGGLNFWHL
jgi:hypothetical protein